MASSFSNWKVRSLRWGTSGCQSRRMARPVVVIVVVVVGVDDDDGWPVLWYINPILIN